METHENAWLSNAPTIDLCIYSGEGPSPWVWGLLEIKALENYATYDILEAF